MMDKLGQYANILNITQSLTFKTFKTQYISSRLEAACWKDWFNRLQINDSFFEQFLAGASPEIWQLSADWYLLLYSGSICVVIGEHVSGVV